MFYAIFGVWASYRIDQVAIRTEVEKISNRWYRCWYILSRCSI